ncbi:MAG: hypothetical protein IPM29_21130 [Planctomycetes bacterium]|nr:hypothetical protein [Planctomycetota bacterium]
MLQLPIRCLAAGVALCAAAAAQQGEDLTQVPIPATTAHAAVPFDGSDGRVDPLTSARIDALVGARTPVHTAPDDPEGGSYGTWAAGASYKASFHDGFRFVPYLGSAYPRTQELRWHTVGATIGGVPVGPLARGLRHDSDYRVEYRYDGLVEAYDVLAEGAEQTFVIGERPAALGDLVVTGKVTTALRAAPMLDEHAELVFRDERGNDVVRYGRAFAVDAHGDRTAAFTSFDGAHIHLRVPGAWLEGAAFPVTIDPLLSRGCVAFWNTVSPAPADGEVQQVATHRDDIADDVLIAYTRAASATDTDMWIYLFTDDTASFGVRNQVWTDITTTWGNVSPAIAFGGGAADSYIVAFIRTNVGGPGVNGARYHVRASGDTALNSTFSSISRPAGTSHGDVIDVGGVLSFDTSSTVFVVFERDDPGSNREVWGRPIDLNGNVQGADVLLDTAAGGTNYTRRRPNINQVAINAADGWVVGWQEYWNSRGVPDDWDINLRRIDGTGTPTGGLAFPNNSVPDSVHKMTPIVTGAGGHYAVGMATWADPALAATTTDVGTDIFCETFDWPAAGSRSFVGISELTAGLVSDRRWRITDGTHDTNTTSHWAFAFESTLSGSQYACSVGFDAGRLERLVALTLGGGTTRAFGGAVHFNDDADQFLFAYASNEDNVGCGTTTLANHPVYTQIMEHLAEPGEVRYGTSCGPGVVGWSGRNLAGVRSYTVTLTSAPANVPAVLFLNAARARVPLDSIGMTGCMLNVSAAGLINLPTATNASGAASQTAPLFSNPAVVCGDLFWQWAYLSRGTNPLGVGATFGLQTSFTCP